MRVATCVCGAPACVYDRADTGANICTGGWHQFPPHLQVDRIPSKAATNPVFIVQTSDDLELELSHQSINA